MTTATAAEANLMRGRFITLEGLEGVGKTSNLETIVSHLQDHGIDPLVTREPGGTEIGEALRKVVLGSGHQMSAMTELMVIAAARLEHVNTVIEPALAAGRWVVSDRYLDASLAYQGGGRELGAEQVLSLHQYIGVTLQPDLTLLLDMSVEAGLERMHTRGEPDRIEQESLAFFERARAAYLAQAQAEPLRMTVINAAYPLIAVQVAVKDRLDDGLQEWLGDRPAIGVAPMGSIESNVELGECHGRST